MGFEAIFGRLVLPSELASNFMVLASSMKIGDKINCGASSQTDFIQNYFLQKRMLRLTNKISPKNRYFWFKNTYFSPL